MLIDIGHFNEHTKLVAAYTADQLVQVLGSSSASLTPNDDYADGWQMIAHRDPYDGLIDRGALLYLVHWLIWLYTS